MLSPTKRSVLGWPQGQRWWRERLSPPFLLLPSSPSIKPHSCSLFSRQLAQNDICHNDKAATAWRALCSMLEGEWRKRTPGSRFLGLYLQWPPSSVICPHVCLHQHPHHSEVSTLISHLFSATTSSLRAHGPMLQSSPTTLSPDTSLMLSYSPGKTPALRKPHLPPYCSFSGHWNETEIKFFFH